MTSLAAASITASGGTASRTFGARLADCVNVKDYGALGDGSHNDRPNIQAALDAAYGATGNGTSTHLNRAVYFPRGLYNIDAPLTIKNTWGAHVFGDGMYSTQIVQTVAGGGCFILDGVGYSTFEHMRLRPNGGVGFDYNWLTGGYMSGQLVTFYKMAFEGGTYGCKVGTGGMQCDTSTWVDCVFQSNTVAGLYVNNLNAIANRVIGGNFQTNAIGIWVVAGAIQSIIGAGFQDNTSWDIKIDGGATDTIVVTSASTESINFCNVGNVAAGINLIGCAQRSLTDGIFVSGAGIVSVDGCWSTQGRVAAGNNVTLKNSFFNRDDALNSLSGAAPRVTINNCTFGDTINSVARREIDTTVTPSSTRTRGIEGTALTDATVVNSGINMNTGAVTIAVAVSIGTPAIVTLNFHGFRAGTPIAFVGGTLPTGIVATATYYVLATSLTTNTFRFSTTVGGAAVNTSGTATGISVYRVRMYAVGDQILKSNVVAAGSPGWICTTAGPALGVAVFKALANVAA